MTAYYNDNEPYAAQWLRNLISANLIAPGHVDERSIIDVRPSDLDGYAQCHFFAGIGGWSLALRLAGWPDDRPCWTGSCPCQPFSSASRGLGKGTLDSRHLWPYAARLIDAKRPGTFFGEQIAQAAAWQSNVGDDLEAMDYAFGSAILSAVGVGKDHVRYRFFFVGNSNRKSKSISAVDDQMARLSQHRSQPRSVVPADGLSTRVATLRALGNAIVPQVAAQFIAAYCEARGD